MDIGYILSGKAIARVTDARNLDVFCGKGKHGEQDCLIYHCRKNATKLVVLIPKAGMAIRQLQRERAW